MSSSLLAVPRLLWRPFTLWSLALCASLANLSWIAARVVLVGPDGPATRTPEGLIDGLHVTLALGTVLIPLAVGACTGWALFEFLCCPFATHLPGLRRRLFPSLTGLALATALLTGLWCDSRPGAQDIWRFAALSFPCFSLGVLAADPIFLRLGVWRWGALALVLTPVFLSPRWVDLGERAPLVAVPLALGLGLGLLLVPFARPLARTRLEMAERMPGFVPSRGTGALQILKPEARARARWNPRRTLAGTKDWVEASLHEGFGHCRGGWVGAVLGFALFSGVALAALCLLWSLRATQDPVEVARRVYGQLAGSAEGVRAPRAPIPVFALPVWVAMSLVSNPFALFGASDYPLGRGDRARVAWGTSLTLVLGQILGLAAVLFLASEWAFQLADLPRRSAAVPHVAHALAGTAIAAPLAHFARLRWIDGRRVSPTPWALAGLIGAAGAVLGLPGIGLALLFDRIAGGRSFLPWLALVLPLAVGAQTLWRRALERHFRTGDLDT